MNRSHARNALVLALSLGAPLAVELGLDGALLEPRVAHAQDAQTAVTAEIVAARVQTFYDQTTSVQASFQQHFWNRVYQRTQSSRGTIAIQRPGRIRFDYAQPRGKVVVSTPAGFVFYEPGDDGSPGQYMRGRSDGASAALGFLTGTARLDRDFTMSLARPSGGAPPPANTDLLELRPRRPDPHFRRVRLYVDNRPATLGVVVRVSIEDPDGNWNTFDFSGLRFNREIPASTFEYTPPADARELTPPAAAPAPARGRAPASGGTSG